ncbi:hypothetical protein BV898_10647 [Hypsibius exemplaris]|uniref:Uncharacterized protein n=1 Tax=Hypsibius exemplaris TaxID=2072580 RepID=A0A1W0WIZ3_HYPEX|nr:hypothetical protein BV898_10647 [Hypsibius exemplaris]
MSCVLEFLYGQRKILPDSFVSVARKWTIVSLSAADIGKETKEWRFMCMLRGSEMTAMKPGCGRRLSDFCRFDPRFGALTGAFITLNMSILSFLLYGWKVLVDFYGHTETADGLTQRYYYGVQISQFVLLSSHLLILLLTVTLFAGIFKERLTLVFAWLVGFVALICLETVCMIYSLVLIAHMHNGMDPLLKAELGFFISRTLLNVLVVYSVIGYHREISAGRTWKPHHNNFL